MTYQRSAIYRIRNLTNGKFYVGSSVDVGIRFQTHRRQLRKGTHHCKPLQRAWDKYGDDSFEFEVLERIPCRDDLHAAENRWLTEHYGTSQCYNTGSRAGAAFLGRNHDEEAKAKVSRLFGFER